MKTALRRIAFVALAACLAAPAMAQTFPERTITIVVPAPPGGSADISARMLAEPLSKALGQPVVIENKGGASGVVGAQAVIAAKPDGHTLLMQFSGFHTMSPHLAKLGYDPMKDLAPVANVLYAPQVLVTRDGLNFKTTEELIKFAKSNPGKLNYASSGPGSVQHVTGELFEQLTGTFIVHIPYRGTGQFLNDLLGNQVDFVLTTAPPLVGHIQSGKLKPLLVTSSERLSALPNVPTSAEVGIKNFEVASWFALYTKAGTPPATIKRISDEVAKIMATPDFQKKADAQGAEARYMNPQQLEKFAKDEFDRWGNVIKTAKITAD